MINQSVNQSSRGGEGTRTTSEITSTSSGSSSDSGSSVTTQGNVRTQAGPGVRTTQSPTDSHGVTPQQTNMPSRHITHIPNTGGGGVFTTRVEIRHEALPDLLHSHVVPSQHQNQVPVVTRHGQQVRQPPPAHILNQRGQVHVRHHPPTHVRRHREHRRRTRSRTQSTSVEEDPCKTGCMNCLAASTSFRWILVILSLLGVCCVVTGIVLAALHAAGNSFLFLAIMFIGLGVLLVVVVAVGWKCTPRGHEPLHALFGLGDFRYQRQRRTRRRRGQHGEGERWYGVVKNNGGENWYLARYGPTPVYLGENLVYWLGDSRVHECVFGIFNYMYQLMAKNFQK